MPISKNEALSSLEPFWKKQIDNYFFNNKIFHAFLLSGAYGVDLDTPAIYLIKKLNPLWNDSLNNDNIDKFVDIVFLDGTNTSIKKEVLSHKITQIFESPLEKVNKIFLIKNIENSSLSVLNSLLKLIEEPPTNVFIIILTHLKDKVLPTILSRCQTMHIGKDTANLLDIKTKKLIPLLQKFFNSKQDILDNYDQASAFIEDLNSILKKAAKDKNVFGIYLENTLQKSNSFLLLMLISSFFSSIYLQKPNSFFDINLFKKYTNFSINYLQMVELINHFLIDQTSNVNFFSLKSKFILDFLGTINEK